EFYFLVAEKAIRKGRSRDRRLSARVDAQADFYHDRIKALATKSALDRNALDDTLDEDMREQVLVCSIAEANCLLCTEEPNFVALFEAASRFNHSCAPNATVESNRATLLVRAAVDIQEGKEVTISYLPKGLLADSSSRRQRLEMGRGFLCRCLQCKDEGLVAPVSESEV
ncbi:unnamed protein product, partial [Polarella glacialis]